MIVSSKLLQLSVKWKLVLTILLMTPDVRTGDWSFICRVGQNRIYTPYIYGFGQPYSYGVAPVHGLLRQMGGGTESPINATLVFPDKVHTHTHTHTYTHTRARGRTP